MNTRSVCICALQKFSPRPRSRGSRSSSSRVLEFSNARCSLEVVIVLFSSARALLLFRREPQLFDRVLRLADTCRFLRVSPPHAFRKAEARLPLLLRRNRRGNTTPTSSSGFQLNLLATLTKSLTAIYQREARSRYLYRGAPRDFTRCWWNAWIYASATGDNPVTYLIGHCNRCGKLQSCNLSGTYFTRSPPMRPCVSNVIYNSVVKKKGQASRLPCGNSREHRHDLADFFFRIIPLAMLRDLNRILSFGKAESRTVTDYRCYSQINRVSRNQ